MTEIIGYTGYIGNGGEMGGITQRIFEIWNQARVTEPARVDLWDKKVSPKDILHSEIKEDILLVASDIVRGESGNIYGHYVSLKQTSSGRVDLTANYLDGTYVIESEEQADLVARELVGQLNEKSWMDL